MKLNKPFWYDFEIGTFQLYWIEMFLSATYYVGRNPEIDIAQGRLIFYKDGTVRLIKK
jgi:hypothetical protein